MIIARNQESVSIVKSRSRKGATRNGAKKTGSVIKGISIAKLLLMVAIVISAVVLYTSLNTVKTVLNVPVSQVDIEGKFYYLGQDEIYQVINQYVVNGFVSVDLEKLRLALLEVPWVYKANIKRKMPNGLVVTLLEQRPLAFWNDDGMINEQRALFFPAKQPANVVLPHLRGKFHKSVLKVYDYLCLALPIEQQPISEVAVSDSNVVHVKLNSGAILIFNSENLLEKVKLWKAISSSDLGSRLNEVDYVDLRYTNGAAVRWKTGVDVIGKNKKAGG